MIWDVRAPGPKLAPSVEILEDMGCGGPLEPPDFWRRTFVGHRVADNGVELIVFAETIADVELFCEMWNEAHKLFREWRFACDQPQLAYELAQQYTGKVEQMHRLFHPRSTDIWQTLLPRIQ